MRNEQLADNTQRTKINRKALTLLFVICYLFFGNCLAFSQTAERIERLLQQDQVSYRDAALLALEASGHLDSENQTSADEAFRFAMERGWLPRGAQADNAVKLNETALLLMSSFGLKGGLFYTLTKSAHHAYRELVYQGMIRDDTDPGMSVSGRQLLLIISRILSVKENEEAQI